MPTEPKNQIINHNLVALIAVGTLLSLGHTADHAIRDDLRWPSAELIAFVIVSLVLYGAIGTGLYLYLKGKVGPRFWTIFAFAGVLFGWAGALQPVHRTAAFVHIERVQPRSRRLGSTRCTAGAYAGDGRCRRVRCISLAPWSPGSKSLIFASRTKSCEPKAA
jgi:hypothetical protein